MSVPPHHQSMVNLAVRMAVNAELYGLGPPASQNIQMTFTRRAKLWQFPQSKFIEYTASDEAWCRFFGIGKEVDGTETLTIPNAVLVSHSPNGSMEFRAIAKGSTCPMT